MRTYFTDKAKLFLEAICLLAALGVVIAGFVLMASY